MAQSQQQVCVRQRGTGGKDEQAEMKAAMAHRSDDDDVCSFRLHQGTLSPRLPL